MAISEGYLDDETFSELLTLFGLNWHADIPAARERWAAIIRYSKMNSRRHVLDVINRLAAAPLESDFQVEFQCAIAEIDRPSRAMLALVAAA